MHDVLIIGSGAAGLTLALSLPITCRVVILSKANICEGSTVYAQGGISAVLDKQDSFSSHIEDTLNAGAGLCDKDVVSFTVTNSTQAVDWLLDCGVPFTREDDTDESSPLHLTREGGHSHRRVAHAADASGLAIESTLVGEVKKRKNITILEDHLAIDLITTRNWV